MNFEAGLCIGLAVGIIAGVAAKIFVDRQVEKQQYGTIKFSDLKNDDKSKNDHYLDHNI